MKDGEIGTANLANFANLEDFDDGVGLDFSKIRSIREIRDAYLFDSLAIFAAVNVHYFSQIRPKVANLRGILLMKNTSRRR